MKAVITAVAALAALGLSASACGTGGTGARDEGPALSDSVASGAGQASAATPSAPASATPVRVNAVRLVKDDPTVSAAVKRDLKPCVADEYPVDVSYGDLTGGSADDVVINVMTCGDAVGVGSYVYREAGGGYENVFRAEEPPVYAEIDRGDLVITQQVYRKGDSVAYPSGEEVITYGWAESRFTERDRIRSDYSKAAGGETPTPAAD